MTDAKLIQSLNTLFGSDRSVLRKKLLDVSANTSKWERVGRAIRKNTRQPVNMNLSLFEETFDNLSDPKADMYWLGDSSYCYEILLNSGVKSGLDWDKKLAVKCGGTAKLCVVWASLLIPYYAIDTYCMKYKSEPGEFIFTPYIPSTKREKLIIAQIRDVMKDNGFARMTKKLSKRKVPRAITDCREKGEATVFNCLFSDTQCYHDDYVRFSDEFMGKRISGAYSGTTVGWYERLNRRGSVIERYTWREYPSGEHVTTYLDKKFRVTKVRISQAGSGGKHSELILDVKTRKVKQDRT